MSLEEKIGQLTQSDVGEGIEPEDIHSGKWDPHIKATGALIVNGKHDSSRV